MEVPHDLAPEYRVSRTWLGYFAAAALSNYDVPLSRLNFRQAGTFIANAIRGQGIPGEATNGMLTTDGNENFVVSHETSEVDRDNAAARFAQAAHDAGKLSLRFIGVRGLPGTDGAIVEEVTTYTWKQPDAEQHALLPELPPAG